MLTEQQQLLVEQRVTNEKKSTGVAYLLWFFLGYLGGHRFYLGRVGSALGMIALLIVGVVTTYFVVGFFLLIALAIWALVDAFLIPGMIRADLQAARVRIGNEVALGTIAQQR